MTRLWFAVVLCAAQASAQAPDLPQVIETYCSGCHNGSMRSPSGVLLDRFDAGSARSDPGMWSKVYRQLLAGTMPPVGAPRPARAVYDGVLSALEKAWGVSGATGPSVDGDEIAVRLAALLWNGAPDKTLGDAARNGQLRGAAVEAQVRRMLADEKAEAFVTGFFFPWLQLDRLHEADPEQRYFPDYDPPVRDAMVQETRLFLLSQLREDRDPVELWSAGETFVNERLARHYEIPGVTGPQFRRVPVKPERRGLLGQGSVLMATSRHQHGVDAAYTSPATRAKWIRTHFLGVDPPNPFPGAQPVKPELPITGQTRTLPVNPCVTCHRNFFPLGYALEHFDPVGRWRTQDQAGPVDASGAFVDGTSTNGIVELRNVLLQRPDAFRTSITEALLVYQQTGMIKAAGGTPNTLLRARQILSGMEKPRWSAVIAAVAGAR